MRLSDNISPLLDDGLRAALQPGALMSVAAYCFSIRKFKVLNTEEAIVRVLTKHKPDRIVFQHADLTEGPSTIVGRQMSRVFSPAIEVKFHRSY